MKGFVPTPSSVVDLMVEKLFDTTPPEPYDSILDPGCGRGAFIEGIIRWCGKNNYAVPQIIGIDSDPKHVAIAKEKFSEFFSVQIRHEDFLLQNPGKFHFIIGNPPYVPITGLTEQEKNEYRSRFHSATGRFDLYFLFFEQALRSLGQNGKLVFITPEKYLSVKSASNLRKIFSDYQIEEIDLLHEQSFGNLATYPAVTTINRVKTIKPTKFVFRNGIIKTVQLPNNGASAFPAIFGEIKKKPGYCTLEEICLRVSCGVATGADAVYVHNKRDIPIHLKKYTSPTITGKDLSFNSLEVRSDLEMIIPYDQNGKIIPEKNLGLLKKFLLVPKNYSRLTKRTCTAKKPWYAFHENPPLAHILQQKILCKDITETPFFRIDHSGEIVPSHSVYYIIPKNPEHLTNLNEYLNSAEVRTWLEAHCQRAANGFLRLQSTILKQIPIPFSILDNKWLSGQNITEETGGITG